MRRLFILHLLIFQQIVAQAAALNVFTQALEAGAATSSLPDELRTPEILSSLKAITGVDADFEIKAWRIKRFEQQINCGRVGFLVWQPSASNMRHEWGGQLNICLDGLPPWRVCPENKHKLIEPKQKCADGTFGKDTPEVEAAIQEALTNGAVPPSEVRKKIVERSQFK